MLSFIWSTHKDNFMPFIIYNPFSLYDDSNYRRPTWIVFPRIGHSILQVKLEFFSGRNEITFCHKNNNSYNSDIFINIIEKIYPFENFHYKYSKDIEGGLFPFWTPKIELSKSYFGIDVSI